MREFYKNGFRLSTHSKDKRTEKQQRKAYQTLIDNEGLVIGDRKNGVIGFVTATDLFKIKFADGTPFGIKEEE